MKLFPTNAFRPNAVRAQAEPDPSGHAPAPVAVAFDGLASAPEPVRRHHFHWGGAVYAVTTLMLAVGAINSQNNLLFWAFGLAVSAIIVSGVLGGWGLMGLAVTREAPRTLRVGEAGRVRYRVTNRNRLFPACAITLTEDAPAGPGRATKPVAFVALLGPRRTIELSVPVAGLARGPMEWSAVRATSTFPLGMALKSVTARERARTLVTPRVVAVKAEALRRVRSRGQEASASSRRGLQGDEFWGLREHADGDDRRLIAWKPSARSTELLVRLTRPRTARRVWLRIVPREGAERERALSLAASLAASLGRGVERSGLEVGVIDGARRLAPGSGVRHLARLEALLADDSQAGEPRATDRPLSGDAAVDLGGPASSPESGMVVGLDEASLRGWTSDGSDWPEPALNAPERGA